MKNLVHLNHYRINHPTLGCGDETCGCFVIPRKGTKEKLCVIASSGGGWDHVSVSLKNTMPTWDDMQMVKELFFKDSETVVQFHPKKTQYINNHSYCLHLWRNQAKEHELPPAFMV